MPPPPALPRPSHPFPTPQPEMKTYDDELVDLVDGESGRDQEASLRGSCRSEEAQGEDGGRSSAEGGRGREDKEERRQLDERQRCGRALLGLGSSSMCELPEACGEVGDDA